jgi:hypothetical protein
MLHHSAGRADLPAHRRKVTQPRIPGAKALVTRLAKGHSPMSKNKLFNIDLQSCPFYGDASSTLIQCSARVNLASTD